MGDHAVSDNKEAFSPHSYRGKDGGLCTYVAASDGDMCARPMFSKRHAGYMPFIRKAAAMPAPAVASEPGNASEAVIAFTAYAEAVTELVRQKDAAYGGAWQKQGYMGNLARIMSKTERLKNMLWQDDQFGPEPPVGGWDESVLDTLKDLMALCAFMGANIEDGNRWGR